MSHTDVAIDRAGDGNDVSETDRDAGAARRRRAALLVVCAVLAFKGALTFQQLGAFVAMKAVGCADASLHIGFGPGSPQARGMESCTDTQIYVAASIGLVAGLALAVPLLVAFASGRGPRRRPLALFLYLLAVGSLAEVLSGTVVFGVFGRFEAAELIAAGVPAWTIVAGGVAIGLALARPVHVTAPQLADLAGRPAHHRHIFQKAVWFKLTFGVAILSTMRVVLSP
ncbi:MAG: hypothetical protein IT198_00650 [Acidimicrobiia bacterium]|nr:hypothetical protein [Acidimicrobiia bacterium]